MKTIINLAYVVIFSLFSITINAQSDTITFYQSIQSTDANLAIIACDGRVDVKVWDKDYIMVHSKVTCSGVQASSIRQLAEEGRYALASEMNFNNFLTISQPKAVNAFKLNNAIHKETIAYTVFVPMQLDLEVEAPNDLVEDYSPTPVIEIIEPVNIMASFYK